jgi:hypothetical protein
MREYKNGLVYLALVVLFLLPFTSAYATDWTMYGGDYSPLWNAQYGSIKGNFSTYTTINFSAGIVVDNPSLKQGSSVSYGYQPIVWGFDAPEGYSNLSHTSNYVVVPTTNYLQIYDKNGVVLSEILTGANVMSQIDILDYNQDGYANEIEGVWKVNTTLAQYRVYLFNTTTSSLSIHYSYDLFANTSTYFTGMRRCGTGMGCLIIAQKINNTDYNNTFYTFNKTTIFSSTLRNSYSLFNKPVAFYDMDNDGKIEYLTNSQNDVLIFNDDGTTRYYYTQSVAQTTIDDSGMFKPDATNQWKLYFLSTKRSATTSLTVYAYKLDGTLYWSKAFTGGNYAYIQKATASVFDNYAGGVSTSNCYPSPTYCWYEWWSPYTGGNDLGIVVTGGQFTSFYTQYINKIVLSGNDGSTLFEDSVSKVLGGDKFNNLYPSLILADTDKQAGQDFNIVLNGFIYSISTYNQNTTPFLNLNLSTPYSSCTIADLNLDGSLDLICSSNAVTQIWYSNTTNQNSVLSGVTYSPTGSTITNSDTLSMSASATDLELDVIIYAVKCGDTDTWHEQNYLSYLSCSPFAVGIYNVSVGVRDGYHTSYSSIISKEISVIVGGGGGTNGTLYTCGNNICESSLGENSVNCPVDCVAVIGGSTNGSVSIPYYLVDPDNSQRGILPELWLGFLSMLSYILFPMSVIIISVIIVATLIAFVVLMQNLLHNIPG